MLNKKSMEFKKDQRTREAHLDELQAWGYRGQVRITCYYGVHVYELCEEGWKDLGIINFRQKSWKPANWWDIWEAHKAEKKALLEGATPFDPEREFDENGMQIWF